MNDRQKSHQGDSLIEKYRSRFEETGPQQPLSYDEGAEIFHAYQKLERRLARIAKISDAFQARLQQTTRELLEKQLLHEKSLATERELREEQAHLIDMISHEYRTPLAIIRANLDLLEIDYVHAGVEESPVLGKMKRAVSRLVELLEVSLRRRQLEMRTPQSNLVRFSFPPLLLEMVDEAGDFWGRSRFQLVHSGPPPDTLEGDRMLLKTAVMNLLDNAIKYSPDNSPVDVELANTGARLVVTVSNQVGSSVFLDGEALFGKYVRGAVSPGHHGSGLGLYLVRQIAQLHRGEARLSQAGTRVTAELSLPLSFVES